MSKGFIDVVLAAAKRQTGAEDVKLSKVLTDRFWTVTASFPDGEFRGEPSYRFQNYTVDLTGPTPKVMM